MLGVGHRWLTLLTYWQKTFCRRISFYVYKPAKEIGTEGCLAAIWQGMQIIKRALDTLDGADVTYLRIQVSRYPGIQGVLKTGCMDALHTLSYKTPWIPGYLDTWIAGWC